MTLRGMVVIHTASRYDSLGSYQLPWAPGFVKRLVKRLLYTNLLACAKKTRLLKYPASYTRLPNSGLFRIWS
jgi:hypothetical protein